MCGKNHVRGALALDELLQGRDEAVGGVLGQQRVLDADDFAGSLGGDFCGEGFGFRAENGGGDFGRGGETLRGGEGFPVDAGDAAGTLLDDNENRRS